MVSMEYFLPQHVETQLDARYTVQVDDGPFEAKTNHAVEVVGSHHHLPLRNIKGVGSIHHLSIRHYTKVALVNFSEKRPMIGLKPAS